MKTQTSLLLRTGVGTPVRSTLKQIESELEQIVQQKNENINMKLKPLTQGDVFSW
jgi:hypothetical protein